MPFLGILEDCRLPQVPGTVLLDESTAQAKPVGSKNLLQHGKSSNRNLILVPQPSDDPNDPLNWSYVQKLTVLGVTLFGSILYYAVITSMFNPAFPVMAKALKVPIADIVRTSGYFNITVGITGPFYSAAAHKYGKRPCFLFSALMALVGHIVGVTIGTESYRGLVTARVLQGFSAAPYEALIYAVVSDLFFVHERGLYMAVTNFVIVAMSNLTGVVSGPIASSLGWSWLWTFMIIFGGAHLVLQFFLVQETSYNRDARREIDRGTKDTVQELAITAQDGKKNAPLPVRLEDGPIDTTRPPLKTYWQSLRVYTGIYSTDSLLRLCFAPLAVMSNFAIAIVVLVYSMSTVMFIVEALVLPQAFAKPPFSLDAAAIGRLFFGPFVGGTIACILNGLISDRLIRWCSRHNQGIYEPEYRLIPGLPAFSMCAGLMGWGVAVGNGSSPYVCAVLHGLTLFGVVFAVNGVSGYAADAYRPMTAEIFICCQIFKNFFAFGFSHFVIDWTDEVGIKHSFYAWGALSLGLAMLLPLLFVFGKQYRSFWARHNLLDKVHILRSHG